MITILDCTLREGGYLNNWNFGAENIKKTIENLLQAGIEYIEVGYLKEALIYDSNIAIFDNINRIQHLLNPSLKRIHLLFMINYGDFSISSIDKVNLDNGVCIEFRIAFHKKQYIEALTFSKKLIDKGFKVWVQPMEITTYSKEELLILSDAINKINPKVFCIVDSLGSITPNVLPHIKEFLLKYIKSDISIGFHFHNNMGFALYNAILLSSEYPNNNYVIDTSIAGIGRGTGNISTETMCTYLQNIDDKKYVFTYLFRAADAALVNMPVHIKENVKNFICAKYNLPIKKLKNTDNTNSLEEIENYIRKDFYHETNNISSSN